MNIVLITTYPEAEEVERLRNETILMGHKFQLIDFGRLGFKVIGNKLTINEISNIKADVVIVRGVFAAINVLTPILDSLRNRNIKVFDNNLSIHNYAINKIADFIKISNVNLPMPDTYYSKNFSDFEKYAKDLGYPVVVKSVRMGKGASVVKFDNKEEMDKYIKEYEKENAKDLIMQKFVDYKYDLRVFVLGDKLFCMRRIPPKNDFRANFSLGGSVELFDLPNDLQELAKKAMKAVSLKIAGVDILVDRNDKAYVLEVNHTPGMLGIEKATGENISKMYIEYAVANAR